MLFQLPFQCALWLCISRLLVFEVSPVAPESSFIGRPCTTGGYGVVRGECKKLSDCPAGISNLRAGLSPSLCYQENGQPIICCPSVNRISAIKCAEYVKQVAEIHSKSDIRPFSVGSFSDQSREPRPNSCNTSMLAFITGGREADINEVSFTVALGYEEGGKGINWKCGGTLISDEFVLTAAHCIDGKASIPPTRVLLGDKRLQKLDKNPRRIEATVEKIYIHPDYKRPAKYHDIGLIKLDRKVKFTSTVQPACLPRPEFRPENWNEFLTSGWGRLEFGGKKSDLLQVVDLQRFPLKECTQVYSSESENFNAELPDGVVKSQICAGSREGTKDSCDGDSGGPLVAKRDKSDCTHFVLGLTSFGSQYCGYGTPAVYTNVQTYLDWLEHIVWED